MPNCTAINVSLELVGVAVLVVLLSASLLRQRQGSTYPLFTATLASLLATTLSDVFAWIFSGAPGAIALLATNCANAVCYFGGAVTYTLYALLTYREVSANNRAKSRLGRAALTGVLVLGAANLVLFLTNGVTGALYTIDAANDFSWGPLRSVPDNILALQLLLVLVAVLAEHNRSRNDTLAGWSLEGLLPLLVVLVENVFPTLMLLYPALAIVLLPVHIWNQHTHQMTLAARERELAIARTESLAEQIKPHFISNTLVAIQQLMVENPTLARQTIQQFSLYLRDNYEAVGSQGLSPFQAELEHARRYVMIEQVDPASKIEFVCNPGPTNFMMPALSLEPLVENAVRHGIGPKPEGGTVTVITADAGDAWLVVVADNGVGIPADAKEGVGISNVRERLHLLCEGSLQVHSNQYGTRITMRLPKKTCSPEASKSAEGTDAE